MTDRFKTKIHIEATEVDVIIRNRLLKKTDAGKQLLEDNYTSNSGKITDTAMLVGNGLTKTDSKENYATYYPFYQYQLQLMQNFLFGKKGYTSTNVAARGMIISAYDILKKEMQEEDVFSTANAWKMTKQAQPQPPALLVNRYESAQRVLEDKSSIISGRSLLETIHFLEDADSAPATVGNIIKAYISQPDQYFQLEKDIKKALDDLVEARILILNDNQYRITSDIEQRLLDEMNEFAVQSFVRKGFLVEYYKKSSFIKSAGSIVDNGINKDTFVDAVEKVEVCATFIKNKQTNAESWKNFVKEVNDDLAKAAKNVQVIATATAEFDVAFCLGIMNKYSELQKLYQQIRDEYFKKYSEAASSMTEKYKTLKDKAIALIQEIDALLR